MDNHSARSSLRDIFMLYIRKFCKSQRAEVLEIRRVEVPKRQSFEEPKTWSLEETNFWRAEEMKSRSAEAHGTHQPWHVALILGHLVVSFARFHVTRATLLSMTHQQPWHHMTSDHHVTLTIFIRENSKNKILNSRSPNFRSESWASISKDMWRQIIDFRYFPLGEFQAQHLKLPKLELLKWI
jgi:hypothetical protein